MSTFSRSLRIELLAALALCACAPTGPAIETGDWGRYHADCGGDGPPVVGCDRGRGEWRWFLGGVVADGYVESPCPTDDVCCLVAPDGAATWVFADWSPRRAQLGTLVARF